MSQKYCTECGAKLPESGKFCAECGAPLLCTKSEKIPADSQPTPPYIGFAPPIGTGQPFNPPTKMGKMSPVDPTLTMLAEYCIKTVATVGGDGYTEWVLNQCADGSLQLDFYRNYVGYEEEIHKSYPAPDDTWDKIIAIKEKYNITKHSSEHSIGMCGGEALIKIREGDEAIRLSRGSLSTEENEAFLQIQNILVEIVSK